MAESPNISAASVFSLVSHVIVDQTANRLIQITHWSIVTQEILVRFFYLQDLITDESRKWNNFYFYQVPLFTPPPHVTFGLCRCHLLLSVTGVSWLIVLQDLSGSQAKDCGRLVTDPKCKLTAGMFAAPTDVTACSVFFSSSQRTVKTKQHVAFNSSISGFEKISLLI